MQTVYVLMLYLTPVYVCANCVISMLLIFGIHLRSLCCVILAVSEAATDRSVHHHSCGIHGHARASPQLCGPRSGCLGNVTCNFHNVTCVPGPHWITLDLIVPYRTILYHTVPYYTILYHTGPYDYSVPIILSCRYNCH